MSLIAKNNDSGTFQEIEAGTYIATCFGIVDLGTQENTMYGGFKRQVLIQFEFPTELITEGEAEGQPFSLGNFYTLSLGEKANLRRDLESWRSRAFTEAELDGFDLQDILGKPCMISVIKNDKGKSKISAISAPVKGTSAPEQVNPSRFFSTEDFEGFDNLTEGLQTIVKKSTEWAGRNMVNNVMNDDYPQGAPPPMEDDGIPF